MPFLSHEQLTAIGFEALGRNVLISDRAGLYGARQMRIGDNARIDDFTVFTGRVTIGRNVHISPFCHVAGGTEGVVFEDFSGFAPGCHVFSESDDYSGKALTNPTVPDQYRLVAKQAVRIGRHCIVGAGSTILPGVTLAEGCSVGAMSLVGRSTEPWGVYVGIPARRVRERSQELLVLEAEYLSQTQSDAAD